MKRIRIVELGQWLGMIALVIGIVLMILDNRAPAETIIAIASLIYAISTKIKYYLKGRKHHGNCISRMVRRIASGIAPWGRDKDYHSGNGVRDGSFIQRVSETGGRADHDGGESKQSISKGGTA